MGVGERLRWNQAACSFREQRSVKETLCFRFSTAIGGGKCVEKLSSLWCLHPLHESLLEFLFCRFRYWLNPIRTYLLLISLL